MLNSAEKWTLGLILSLCNCFLSSIGLAMQRKASLRSADGDNENKLQGSLATRMLWPTGFILYIAAAPPEVFAYLLAPQVVCTAVACLRLVVITVLAHFFLEERMNDQQILGMLACCLGTFLCIYFGPDSDTRKHIPPGEMAFRPVVALYLAVGLSILVLLLAVEHLKDCFPKYVESLKECYKEKGLGFCHCVLPMATGLGFGLEKVFNTEIGYLDGPDSFKQVFNEGLAAISPPWALSWGAVCLLGLTDLYLNTRGAKCMELHVFIPLVFTFATSLQYFQSIFIFSEFQHLSMCHTAISFGGACMSLFGALYMECNKPKSHQSLSSTDPPPDEQFLDDEFIYDGLLSYWCGSPDQKSWSSVPAWQ